MNKHSHDNVKVSTMTVDEAHEMVMNVLEEVEEDFDKETAALKEQLSAAEAQALATDCFCEFHQNPPRARSSCGRTRVSDCENARLLNVI